MRFDPLSGTADLFVDGIERISDYGGNTINTGSSLVQFGAAQSNSAGHGHYNLVQFSTVPEPSSTVLFLVGSMFANSSKSNKQALAVRESRKDIGSIGHKL